MTRSVLICDDEAAARMNLKAMLRDIGFDDVLECWNGRRAVEMAVASFPDVVILGMAMPEIDGISAAGEIRKKLNVPLLLLTNGCDAKTSKRAVTAGIASFLNKPLRQQDLLPAIEVAIAHVGEVENLQRKIDDLNETIENRKVVEKAKWILMEREGCSEGEAYRNMQKIAMNRRISLRQVADQIIRK